MSSEAWASLRQPAKVRAAFFRAVKRRSLYLVKALFVVWGGLAGCSIRCQRTVEQTAGNAMQHSRDLPMIASRILVSMRKLAKEAAVRLHGDRQARLVAKANEAALELAAGRSGKLWELARQVAGRRGKKGPRAAIVVKNAAGTMVGR